MSLQERRECLAGNESFQDFLETLREALEIWGLDTRAHGRLLEGVELAEYFALDPAPLTSEDVEMLSAMGAVLSAEAHVELGDEALSALETLTERFVHLRMMTYALGFYRGQRWQRESV